PFARERYWIPTVISRDNAGHLSATNTAISGTSPQTVSLAPLRPAEEMRTVLLTSDWQEEEIIPASPSQRSAILAQQVVLLCELPGIEASRIQAQLVDGGHCRKLKVQSWESLQPRREQRFQDMVIQLIKELQHLFQSQPAEHVLVQAIEVRRQEPSLLEALA